MSTPRLEDAVGPSARLVAVGLFVQMVSFFWNHPLAFIAFAVAGGGLVVAGVGRFALTAYRERSWRHEVTAPPSDSR